MKTFCILNLSAKNNYSLKKCETHLLALMAEALGFSRQFRAIKKRRKLLTILKSPHVNKTAQERYSFLIKSKTISLKNITQTFKFLIFLKKIETVLFPEVNISLTFIDAGNKKNSFVKIAYGTYTSSLRSGSAKNLKKGIKKQKGSIIKKACSDVFFLSAPSKLRLRVKHVKNYQALNGKLECFCDMIKHSKLYSKNNNTFKTIKTNEYLNISYRYSKAISGIKQARNIIKTFTTQKLKRL